eukprot:scaffold271116_cov16-Prasinocladus_malaysianus.AAC.1
MGVLLYPTNRRLPLPQAVKPGTKGKKGAKAAQPASVECLASTLSKSPSEALAATRALLTTPHDSPSTVALVAAALAQAIRHASVANEVVVPAAAELVRIARATLSNNNDNNDNSSIKSSKNNNAATLPPDTNQRGRTRL